MESISSFGRYSRERSVGSTPVGGSQYGLTCLSLLTPKQSEQSQGFGLICSGHNHLVSSFIYARPQVSEPRTCNGTSGKYAGNRSMHFLVTSDRCPMFGKTSTNVAKARGAIPAACQPTDHRRRSARGVDGKPGARARRHPTGRRLGAPHWREALCVEV